MKKIISLILALTLVLLMCGCETETQKEKCAELEGYHWCEDVWLDVPDGMMASDEYYADYDCIDMLEWYGDNWEELYYLMQNFDNLEDYFYTNEEIDEGFEDALIYLQELEQRIDQLETRLETQELFYTYTLEIVTVNVDYTLFNNEVTVVQIEVCIDTCEIIEFTQTDFVVSEEDLFSDIQAYAQDLYDLLEVFN